MRSLQAIVLICTLCGADTFERQTAHLHGYALDRRSALVGGVSALLTGGATAAEAAPTVPVVFDPMGPQMMAGSKLPDQIIYDTASASFHPARKIAARLAEAQAIFVGEVHDDARHHAVQFQIARALQRRAEELSTEGGVAIGCEYFYRSQQPILDAFVAGTPATHDLNWLRAATKWDQTWGWDFRTYAMLFGWAQARGVRLVGLNAPEPVVRIVRERQYEQDPTLLKMLPKGGMDLSNVAHRARFESTMESVHASMGKPAPLAPAMQSMYEVQTLWEEYMAESCVEHLQAHGGQLIVLAGANHVEHRDGLPGRFVRRLTAETGMARSGVGRGRAAAGGQQQHTPGASLPFTVIPRTVELPVCESCASAEFSSEFADWVWFVGTQYGREA